MIRTVLFVGAVFLMPSASAWAQEGSRGPLAVREQSPLYALAYVPTGESATLLTPGATEFELVVGYSNIFERASRGRYSLYLDVERMSSSLRYRRGLGPRLEVAGEFSVQTNWGGVLDPVVQELHDLFGLPNGDREREPHGQTALQVRRDGRLVFDAPAARLGIGRVVGSLKGRLYQSETAAVSGRVAVQLPVGSRDAHSGHTDVAFEALAQRSWGAWHMHGMVGWTSARAPGWAAEIARPGAWLGMVAMERSLGRISLLAQVATSQVYFGGTGIKELDRRPSLLAVGVRGRKGDWGWEVGFVEDVPANSPSADFTVHFGLQRLWP